MLEHLYNRPLPSFQHALNCRIQCQCRHTCSMIFSLPGRLTDLSKYSTCTMILTISEAIFSVWFSVPDILKCVYTAKNVYLDKRLAQNDN